MRGNKWQLLTVFLVLALVVPLAAACGPTPEPEVIKETVVVTEKETVVVAEKETVIVTEKETTVVKEEVVVTATPPPEPTAVPEGFIQRGGTLRTEYAWMPYVEDPAADGVGTGYVGLSIAESLVWVGEDGVPRPLLAKPHSRFPKASRLCPNICPTESGSSQIGWMGQGKICTRRRQRQRLLPVKATCRQRKR